MKKYIPLTLVLILVVLAYKNRYLLTLGFDYISWKSAGNEIHIEEPVIRNPLDEIMRQPAPVEEQPVIQIVNNTEDELEAVVDEKITDETISATQPKVETHDKAAVSTEPVKQSFEEITSYYNEKLTYLEHEFRASLEQLIQSALSDYKSEDYKKSELAKIYLKKGEDMEKTSDEKFYSMLKEFKHSLSTNGYATDLVKDVDRYYTALKKAERAKLVDKGMSIVNTSKD
ncbi:MAG: hypothetical protein RBT15_04120 [Gudongella sp.]|jgi:hypothetical protein|nr:hypothetical protein [Gudongella sp.]